MQGIFGEPERAHNDCICTSHPSLFIQLGPWSHEDGRRYRLSGLGLGLLFNAGEFSGWLDRALRMYISSIILTIIINMYHIFIAVFLHKQSNHCH